MSGPRRPPSRDARVTGGEAERRRVVVTGLGPITAAGIGVDGLWEGLQRARSPVTGVTRFDSSPFRTQIAAEVNHFDPLDFMERTAARRLDRFGHFSIAATRQAVADAGLEDASLDGDRVAVQMGSALGGVAHAEAQLGRFLDRGPKAVDPRLALTVFTGAASCNIAIEFGFTGPTPPTA